MIQMFEEDYYMINKGDRVLYICRGYGKTPNGTPMKGHWGVFDEETGEVLDYSQYRNDMVEKWK